MAESFGKDLGQRVSMGGVKAGDGPPGQDLSVCLSPHCPLICCGIGRVTRGSCRGILTALPPATGRGMPSPMVTSCLSVSASQSVNHSIMSAKTGLIGTKTIVPFRRVIVYEALPGLDVWPIAAKTVVLLAHQVVVFQLMKLS